MINWNDITFAHPWVFWFLTIIPVVVFVSIYFENQRTAKIVFTRTSLLSSMSGLRHSWQRFIPMVLRITALGFIITALARPQSNLSWQDQTTEGIDIIIALDISSSMLAADFKPNRIAVSKEVALNFIDKRLNDRIGLVVYAGESFTQCPLTTDHDVVKNLFDGIEVGMIEDGTAIGSGLATSISRLKESKAKSKVVILLTDGMNNSGQVAPQTAAEIASTFGIRVYTIGVGTRGVAPYPVQTPFGGTVMQNQEVRIDEETLQAIAERTDGSYFRATDKEKLVGIYEEIDQLEKSKIEVTEYRKKKEEFLPLVLLAGVLLLLEFLLKKTWLKSVLN